MASVWEKAFGAIQTALNVVSMAGNLPGAQLIPHVATITTAANAIQTALNVGIKVTPYIKAVIDTYTDGVPTDEQRKALDAKIAQLEAKVQEKLPEKDPNEPD